MEINKVSSDFLIIGSGLAGLTAAIYAAKIGSVTLVTKSKLNFSSSYWAQGGIAAAIGNDDSAELHFRDTIKAGDNLCNKDSVKILVNEGIDRVNDLINWGMEFDKSDSEIHLGLEGGHSKRRILHAGGDSTGREIVNFLTKIIISDIKIKIFENTSVIELLEKDGICNGANSFDWYKREQILFLAKNTVLATGGGSSIYSRSTNPYVSTGDGISLAYKIGAEIQDMEFVQFHPTAFYSDNDQTFLLTEALRGEGAYLRNAEGRRFMEHIHPQSELAPRDVVSKAIFYEIRNSKIKSVFLDLTHLEKNKIKNRFKTIYEKTLEYGLDITANLIPVSPAAHYMIGGIKTDGNGKTNINNLFACGEVSSTGIHGANRLASNSLLECLVFGKRAIDEANKCQTQFEVPKLEKFNIKEYSIVHVKYKDFLSIKNKIATLLNTNVGIIRNSALLEDAQSKINDFKGYININKFEYYSSRVESIIDVAELIIKSAIYREESRGVHQRSDFLKPNIKFIGHLVISKNNKIKFRK